MKQTKICRDCNCEKDINEFRKNSKQCRKCEAIYKREYYLKTRKHKLEYCKKYREEHKEFYKKYREEHKEKMKIEHKKYYIKNKEELTKKAREYQKNKLRYDNMYKMKSQIRKMIRFSFTRKGLTKNEKTENIVGCSLDYLYKYLLKTFEKNYGYEWDKKEPVHIDHIKPLIIANNEEEIIKLCNYKNLQLLKEKDNLEKGTKLNWELYK